MAIEEPLSQLEPAVDMADGAFRQEWHSWFFRLVEAIKQGFAAVKIGVVDGSNTAPGEIGEFISASREGGPTLLPLVSTVWIDVVSISLTPGDWDVSSIAQFTVEIPALVTDIIGSVSETSATPNFLVNRFASFTNNDTSMGHRAISVTPPTCRISTSTAKTIFLVAKSDFTGGAGAVIVVGGYLGARRVR